MGGRPGPVVGHWVGLPREAGDLIGEHLIGAAPGQVLVVDSTTVNLFKLAMRRWTHSRAARCMITDDDNFPTDRYVLQGVAAQRGCELRMIHTDLDEGLAERRAARGARTRRRPGQPVARRLPQRRAGRHGADHRPGARRRRAGALGSVPLGGRRAGQARRQRGRSRDRLHLQVPQRGAGRPGVPLCPAGTAGPAAAADLGLVRPAGSVRDGAGLRPGAGHRAVRHRHSADHRHGRRGGGHEAARPRPGSTGCARRASR